MANTYVKIASYAATGSVATIDLTSIPSTYTDLLLRGSIRGTNASTYSQVTMTFNGSTSGYSSRNLEGGDGAAASYSTSSAAYVTAGYVSGANATASTFGVFDVYIPNYAGSANKSMSVDSAGETNAANGIYMDFFANLWANSAAINQITLSLTNIAQYSTVTLYGISKS